MRHFKKVLLALVMIMLKPQCAAAQEGGDTINEPSALQNETNVLISVDDLGKLRENEKRYFNIKPKYDSLVIVHKEDADKIDLLRRQNKTNEDRIKRLEQEKKTVNKILINIASNFLCIPYEAYSVEKIAIPAFEAISNERLKVEYRERYNLLKNYKCHIEELKDFLVEQNKSLSGPFIGKVQSEEALVAMRQKKFYISYQGFGKRSVTYLWKKIEELERQLQTFDGETHKFNV